MEDLHHALGVLEDFHRAYLKHRAKHFLYLVFMSVGMMGLAVTIIGMVGVPETFTDTQVWFLAPSFLFVTGISLLPVLRAGNTLFHYRWAIDRLAPVLYRELKDREGGLSPLTREVIRIRLDRISQQPQD